MTASNEWQSYTLADIGEFKGGATPSTTTPSFWGGRIAWTTSKRLGSYLRVDSGERFITEAGLEGSSTSLIPKGNLLIGTRVGVGKVAVNLIDVAISQDLNGVIVDRTRFNSFFLAYCLAQSEIQERIVQQARGVTIKGIPREDLKRIEFNAPALHEQVVIAAVLRKLQSGIEVEEQIVSSVRELKQSAMCQLFTRGLRGDPQRETDVGPLPESWAVRPFGECREFLQYGTSAKCDYHGKGNPVIRIPNVADGKVDATDLKWCELTEREIESLQLEDGDLLFVRTNGVRERVGTCAVYRNQPECALFASYLIRARLKPGELDPSFFQYFSMTPAGASQLSGRASPAADGKFNVNTKTIDSILVPAPSIDEQREIAAILGTIDRKISVHERKRDTMLQLFKTLLHQLMTGQIRVADLDIDTKEVAA